MNLDALASAIKIAAEARTAAQQDLQKAIAALPEQAAVKKANETYLQAVGAFNQAAFEAGVPVAGIRNAPPATPPDPRMPRLPQRGGTGRR